MTAFTQAWLTSSAPIATLAILAWVLCSLRRNVGLIDMFWPLFMLAAVITAVVRGNPPTTVGIAACAIVALWALRLCVYLTARNWSAPEDRRYQAIRARNGNHFVWTSLVTVFLFQAVLAWIVAAPAVAAVAFDVHSQWWNCLGAALALFGLLFESLADEQLRQFKSNGQNASRVLDTGLWRYSRHPNYFGEFCLWWGIFLLGARPGTLWTIVSPALMTLLLLRVSGVTLLEKDIAERRPAYRRYVARTSAFVPWFVRSDRA
ncbi:MAG: DUF1295 domain-containing protein [Steroidobacteraceae bacterium]